MTYHKYISDKRLFQKACRGYKANMKLICLVSRSIGLQLKTNRRQLAEVLYVLPAVGDRWWVMSSPAEVGLMGCFVRAICKLTL